MKYCIIDDEPIAHRIIEGYCENLSYLQKIGNCYDAFEAMQLLKNNSVDLIFLDINMPKLSGFELLKTMQQFPKVIVTSAYEEFALEGYELNISDYLLKPFEFERFYKAVLKLNEPVKTVEPSTITDDFLFVKTDGKNNFEKIYIKDIQYIEGLKNYVAIHLVDKQIITYNTLKNIEECLPTSMFIKTHKSYIISLAHITKTDSNSVYIQNTDIPIGDTYKKGFFERIQERKL